MNIHEIAFKYYIGESIGDELKKSINLELENGNFKYYYLLAVKHDPLDYYEIEQIIKKMRSENLEIFKLWEAIAATCKKLTIPTVENDYAIVDTENVLWSDGLHIFRMNKTDILWKSKRISVDGVRELEYKTEEDAVYGLSYEPNSKEGKWTKFKINYNNGKIL